VDELFAEFGSPDKETVAVFERVCAVAGAVPVIVMVAAAPMAITEVIEQVTVAVPLQDHPADAATETLVSPDGRASESTLEVTGALACPRFWTVIV
jgi:hypothetical protein